MVDELRPMDSENARLIMRDRLFYNIIDKHFVTTIRYAFFAFIGYGIFFKTIPELAGQKTEIIFNAIFKAVFDFRTFIAFVPTGFFYYLYTRQKKLAEEKTTLLQQRVIRYENLEDPGRTSSNLTIEGHTNPEDR